MKKYRVVILGAGIAGLSAALYLRSLHIDDFIVLNPVNRNIHKACTGLLTEKTVSLLNELKVPLDGYKKVNNFVAKYNGSLKDLSRSGLSLHYHKDTGRTFLDDSLYETCLSNDIEIIDNCVDICIDDKKHIVSFSNSSISYQYLIDARGFYSDIAHTKHKDIGFEAKIVHGDLDIESGGEIILDNQIKGYGWIIHGPHYDVIGMADEYRKNIDYQKRFNDFIKKYYSGDTSKMEIKGAFVPIKPNKLILNSYHAQIGDKAGLVDPLTQEGIYYALYSGKQVATAISKNNLKLYRKSMKNIANNFSFAYRLRKFFFSNKFRLKFWNIVISHHFADYLFMRYTNDNHTFLYKKIAIYRKEYHRKDL